MEHRLCVDFQFFSYVFSTQIYVKIQPQLWPHTIFESYDLYKHEFTVPVDASIHVTARDFLAKLFLEFKKKIYLYISK